MVESTLREELLKFIESMFKNLLVERDLTKLSEVFDENISWLCVSDGALCSNAETAKVMLKKEICQLKTFFAIVDKEISEPIKLGDGTYLVYGAFQLRDRDELDGDKLKLRFTTICKGEQGKWKMLHFHCSSPTSVNAFEQLSISKKYDDYSVFLEQKLVKKTEQLKEKTIQLNSILENIYGGVELCETDDDFTIKYANNGFYRLLEYTKKDMKEKFNNKHFELIHPDDRLHTKLSIKSQISKSKSFSLEYRMITAKGKIIWVMDRGFLFTRDDGTSEVQCIIMDITQHKENEAALRLSEKRYEIAMEISNCTMFEYDIVRDEIIFFDPTAQMYGMPNIIANGVETLAKKIIHADCIFEYKEMYRKVREGASFAKCAVKTWDKDGILHFYELSLTTVFDSNKKAIRAIGVRQNISEKMMLEKELEFNKNIMGNSEYIFEANLTTNCINYYSETKQGDYKNNEDEPFGRYLRRMVCEYVREEYYSEFFDKINLPYVAKKNDKDENLFSFEYRKLNDENWYRGVVNIIKNAFTGDITIRFHSRNITDLKKEEKRIVEEQRFYKSMLSKVNRIYEINLTEDLIIRSEVNYSSLFGIENITKFSEYVKEFKAKLLHPDDEFIFDTHFDLATMKRYYKNGQEKLFCQYRTMDYKGDFRWVNTTIHLMDDGLSHDIKGYIYVEDIHEQKQEEISLLFKAEHDLLTGLYNKKTVEMKIKEFLTSEEGKLGDHTFFMLDIDNFKDINDTFGHMYGDNVIKDVADKIAAIFRGNDIVGRLGGDEYVVLLKNNSTVELASFKAEQLCNAIRSEYAKDDEHCSISASVGIALYPENGANFEQLYNASDKALYDAKDSGRDCYRFAGDRAKAFKTKRN